MTLPNPWQSYRQVATKTAPPGQLVLMLYDGAIRFLEKARLGFQATDPKEFHETIHNNICRGQEIIRELNVALDMKAGGELAATLRRLYDYMDRLLDQSNLHKEENGIVETIQRLGTLRQAWAEMLKKTGETPATPELATLSAVG